MKNPYLEVTPTLPAPISRLPELAANLFFSWDRSTRMLFEDLDRELWKQSGGNPRLLLRCVSQHALDRAAADEEYVGRYHQVLQAFDTYLAAPAPDPFPAHWDPKLRIPRGQVVAAASIVSPKY